MNKENVYIIIPVHNRKDITISCLNNLAENFDMDRYQVIVVDDGSTDGTSEAIKSLYPDVIILVGDGNLWWTGAIRKGMEYAYAQGAEYFIWLNDDCYPHKSTIPKILELCKLNTNWIVSAQSIDPDTQEVSYGGVTTQRNYLQPIKTNQLDFIECDCLNGNLVCLPSNIVNDIGYPDNKKFPHHFGDFIYTNLAKKKSYKLILNKQAIAFCKDVNLNISWITSNISLLNYWKEYWQPKSSHYWKIECQAYQEIFGYKGIVYYFYQKHLKLLLILIFIYPLPLKVKTKIKNLYRKFLKTN